MACLVKKISLLVFVFSIFCLSSCSKYSPFINEHAVIRENAEQMLQCIIDRDAEKLLTFFSAEIQENESEETLEEIEKLLEFIDGDITSYSYNLAGGSKSISDFEIDYYHCYPTFNKTETTTGKIYTIQFLYCYLWKEKPEQEGICKIIAFRGEDWANSEKGVTVGKLYDPPF